MTELSLTTGPEVGETLVCGLTPSGRIDVRSGTPEDGPQLSAAAAGRILDAFNAGRGHGVLHLGAREVGTDLHPTLSYWRDIGVFKRYNLVTEQELRGIKWADQGGIAGDMDTYMDTRQKERATASP